MNCIIPFESKVKFNSPVSEICSISLEHEITKNESEILGNFIVYGDYKEYELSMNTKDFKFTIPFSVELATRIDHDTLDFGIDNFTYDLEGNEMLVKIDYTLNADDLREEENIYEPVEIIEEPLDLVDVKEEDSLNKKEVREDETKIKEEDSMQGEEVKVVETTPENEEIILPKLKEEPVLDAQEEMNFIEKTTNKRALDIEDKISSLVETESDYMTYHVHVIKTGETIESIAMLYHADKDDIEKINDLTTLHENDKLLIPIYE